MKCPPEIGPSAAAIVRTVNPNASATPAKPIPRAGKPAASTALPQPPSTNQKVPTNSAVDRRSSDMRSNVGSQSAAPKLEPA